jgi:ABC-type transport system substrate-binding protein
VKNPGQYILELADLSYSSLDLATNYESGGSSLNSMICETLYDYDGDSLTDLVPALASKAPVWNKAGTQVNVTLKQGIYFHDGVEFNAWVYKYSIDRVNIISDPNGPSNMLDALAGAETIGTYRDINNSEVIDYITKGGVKVLNDYEIQLNLDYGYVPIIAVLTYQVGCAVSPKAVIDHIPMTFIPDKADNVTGMVDLADWFPELHGDYSKLGLNATINSQYSGVIPSGYVEEGSPAQHIWFEDHQIGTGPWILTDKTSEIITMERNPNWWNASAYHENAPTQIIIKAVADANTRALDLTNGDADNAQIDVDLRDAILKSDGSTKQDTVKSYKFDTINIGFLGFNQRNGSELGYNIDKYEYSSPIWDNDTALYNAGFVGYNHLQKNATVTNPFTVLKFRQAFSLAFDYNAYIQNFLGGLGRRLEGLIPAGLFGHQDTLIEEGYIPEYDPDAAKALFEELNWRGSITLAYNTASKPRKALASILKNSIEGMNVGINIVVKEILWNNYLQQYYQAPIFTLGWAPDFADPDNYMTPLVHSSKGYYSARIKYINPNLDPMLSAAASESDPAQRNVLYANLEKYIAEESVFMYTDQQKAVATMWYQWNGYEESGSRNPMRNFRLVHFMDKVAQARVVITSFSEECSCMPPVTTINILANQSLKFFDFNISDEIFSLLFVSTASLTTFILFSLNKMRSKKFDKFNDNANFNNKSVQEKKKQNYFNGEILTKIETIIDEFSEKKH